MHVARFRIKPSLTAALEHADGQHIGSGSSGKTLRLRKRQAGASLRVSTATASCRDHYYIFMCVVVDGPSDTVTLKIAARPTIP
jgi:hypothetical protein